MRCLKVAHRLHLNRVIATLKKPLKTIGYVKKVAGCTYFSLIRKNKLNIIFYVYRVSKGCNPETSETFSNKTLITQGFQACHF